MRAIIREIREKHHILTTLPIKKTRFSRLKTKDTFRESKNKFGETKDADREGKIASALLQSPEEFETKGRRQEARL